MQHVSATYILLLSNALFGLVVALPSPVSVNFGTTFLGSDGLWSAAQIRVGTPQQWLSVYPSTVSSETWVIGVSGCDNTLDCQQSRGGLFWANRSSSYQHLGLFDLTQNRLGLKANYGDYGLDSVAISDSVSAPAQVVATINSTETYQGQLGLGVQETRFENNIDHLSFINSLVQNQSDIPSHSYGYTAGAYYKGKHVPGSLVLGGVDTTRFDASNTTFTLNAGKIPVVAVTSIIASSSQAQGQLSLPPNWNTNPYSLMQSTQASLFTIDTSTPYLWMPEAVCDNFAQALNLTYNTDLGLYLFANNSNPQNLKNWNLTFTFSLSDTTNSPSKLVQIPISYDAFNLQLRHGFPRLNLSYNDAGINYFPLRRANSSDQYTIGRAFLQESYLKVEYESNVFSISPALFPDVNTVLPNLVAIERPAGSTWPGPQSDSSSLSTGTKAGIGVGVVVIVGVALAIIIFVVRRRKANKIADEKSAGKKWWRLSRSSKKSETTTTPVAELLADRRQPRELLVDSSNSRYELPGQAPVEMGAAEVPEAYLAANQASDGTLILAAQGTELGLANHSSIRKDYNIRTTVVERSESPAPPYSPSEVGRATNTNSDTNNTSHSGGISPYGSGMGAEFGSQRSSAGVSPIARYGTQSTRTATSPVSPNMRDTGTLSSTGVSSGTGSSAGSSAVMPRPNTNTTAADHQEPSRETVVDSSESSLDNVEPRQQLRPRFSWEQ